MSSPFLVGERISLRPLTAADLSSAYLDWVNDHEVTRFMETGVFPTTAEALQHYATSLIESRQNVLLAIVDKSSGRHIGNVKLGPIEWVHRRALIGIMIGEKAFRGRGLGREVVELVLGYAFDRLNLHKVCLGVDADHVQAVKLYQRVGFKLEGTERQHVFRDGSFRDHYRMGLLRSEYQRREGA